MPTIVATVGGASSNSFASVSQADTYLDGRLNATAWTDETDDDQKARALIEATRHLSELETLLQGFRTDAVQALCWPRQYVINKKAPINSPIGLSGFPEYDDDVIPSDWQSATIELALEYLRAGDTDVAALNTEQVVIEETVDVITTRYAEPPTAVTTATGIAQFPRVMALVLQFFETVGGSSLAVVRT